MRSLRRALGTCLLAISTAAAVCAAASPSSAATLKCDNAHANQLLEAHGVTAASPEQSVAVIQRQGGVRFCWVSADLGQVMLHTSPNGAVLWTTVTSSQVKRTHTEKRTVTAAGRKAFGVKHQTFTKKSTWSAKKVKQKVTFRNANGSTGKRVSTARHNKKGWKHQVVITLVAKNGAKTRVGISENCQPATSGPRCTGESTSNKKRLRGSYDVRLKVKSHGDVQISHGVARAGAGKAVYNRVYKLDRVQFEQERNGFAGGAG